MYKKRLDSYFKTKKYKGIFVLLNIYISFFFFFFFFFFVVVVERKIISCIYLFILLKNTKISRGIKGNSLINYKKFPCIYIFKNAMAITHCFPFSFFGNLRERVTFLYQEFDNTQFSKHEFRSITTSTHNFCRFFFTLILKYMA